MNSSIESCLKQIKDLQKYISQLNQKLQMANEEIQQLKQNESKFRNVVEASPNGFILVDVRGIITLVNKKTESMFGYGRNELLGQKVEILLPEVHRNNHEHYRDEFFKEPVTRPMGAGRDLFGLHKNGSLIPVEIGLNPITTSEGNFVIASIIDITKRKEDEAAIYESEERLRIVRAKAEEALKESEEKFRSLFENITEGVAIYEIVYENDIPVNYRVIDVNPAFEHYCEIGRKMVVGNLITDIYKSKEPPYFNEYLEVALSGKPYRFESFFEKMKKYFMISVISPKKGQFATVYEDITEHKKSEQEIKQKNEELTRFIYTVSHDLKSPLITIKSFSSYLKEDVESMDKASQEKDISYIQNAADKMGRLLDELLELSRVGRKEDPKTAVSLQSIAQAAIDLVAGRLRMRQIEVVITGPPVMLYGHEQRLIQLFQNLIDNAAKFMGNQAEPLIEIGSYPAKNKNILVLYVRDNGIGIDPKYHHKLFGLFEKLDAKSEGTGIGLALIKRITEVHNGYICLDSEGQDKGTTFYFTLDGSYILNEVE